jgi:hypothetical protein
MIREYFLDYNEAMTNDFTSARGGKGASSCTPRPR